MKKILILLFTVFSLHLSAQEAVLLRANYTKGDVFLITQDISQDMGPQGGLDMKMSMEMKVNTVEGDTISTASQIKKISMNMLQAGQIMSFDSTTKEEDLDQMGKMMKQQMDPMLKATIFSKISSLGEVLDLKIDPLTPAMDQFTKQNQSIKYPQEKVSVGDSWSDESSLQGIVTVMTFTVSKIENNKVYLSVKGELSGIATGTATGNVVVDAVTGVQGEVNTVISMDAAGVSVKITTKSTTTKL